MMNNLEIRVLCEEIQSFTEQIDENSGMGDFINSLDDAEDILMGTMIARGFLEGTVTISKTTVPFLKAAHEALALSAGETEDIDEEFEEEGDE